MLQMFEKAIVFVEGALHSMAADMNGNSLIQNRISEKISL